MIVCGFDSHLGHVDEYWKRYHREYYYKRRLEAFDYIGYRHCNWCGSTENLEIDHIDPSQKSFNLSMRLSARRPEVQAELDKCQVLCRSCHEEKTAAENSGFTHGTIYAWMNKKCRCEICEPERRAWHDARNKKRREQATYKRGPYGRPSEHGEILHYQRGCRCADCRAANTARQRVLREAKRERDSTHLGKGRDSEVG